jgi:hypothetical protein
LVQIFNYAVSATDVANLYNRSKPLIPQPPSTAGPVGYWKLDEGTGPSSYDSSGNNITGTWTDGPAFSATKPPAITFSDPGCLLFNSTLGQFVTMGTPTQLPSGDSPKTICGWAKNNGSSGHAAIAAYGTAYSGESLWIGANGTSLSAGGWGNDLPDIPNFWDGNWHFIVLTYDGTTAKLYADGVLKESAVRNWYVVPNMCFIGAYLDYNSFWNGYVDDVRIYSRVLSATEVSALAAGNLNP